MSTCSGEVLGRIHRPPDRSAAHPTWSTDPSLPVSQLRACHLSPASADLSSPPISSIPPQSLPSQSSNASPLPPQYSSSQSHLLARSRVSASIERAHAAFVTKNSMASDDAFLTVDEHGYSLPEYAGLIRKMVQTTASANPAMASELQLQHEVRSTRKAGELAPRVKPLATHPCLYLAPSLPTPAHEFLRSPLCAYSCHQPYSQIPFLRMLAPTLQNLMWPPSQMVAPTPTRTSVHAPLLVMLAGARHDRDSRAPLDATRSPTFRRDAAGA